MGDGGAFLEVLLNARAPSSSRDSNQIRVCVTIVGCSILRYKRESILCLRVTMVELRWHRTHNHLNNTTEFHEMLACHNLFLSSLSKNAQCMDQFSILICRQRHWVHV